MHWKGLRGWVDKEHGEGGLSGFVCCCDGMVGWDERVVQSIDMMC